MAWYSGLWPATRNDLNATERHIDMKLSELTPVLTALGDKVDKIKTEVQALKDSLADVELPSGAQAALDRVIASVGAVDDINPDA